jgi:hypothetical protein
MNLERYLIPKNGNPPTREFLHQQNRGIAYTTSAYAYVFKRD